MPRYVVSIREVGLSLFIPCKICSLRLWTIRNDGYFLVPNGAPFLGLYKISIFAFNNPASMYVVKD